MSASAIEKKKFLAPSLLVIIPLFAYWPIFHGGFIWDDDVLITENPVMKMPDGLTLIWRGVGVPDYYPLPYSMFWFEWRIFGMFAPGYHIVNVVLHIIGVLLLWRVLLRLAIPGAIWIALIFAVHPVGAASVAWISEAKNTISLIFFVLTLLFFLRSEKNPRLQNSQSSTSNSQFFYWLSLVTFVLTLLGKTSVVMLPVLLIGCTWWTRDEISAHDLQRAVPFFVLSLAAALVTLWFQKNRAGTAHFSESLSFLERLAGAAPALWFYFFKALWPVNLMPIYPNSKIAIASPFAWLSLAVLVLAFAMSWRFRRTWGRPVLFALAYFVLLLLPVLGFFDIYYFLFSRVADHWNYLSLIGIISLVVGPGFYVLRSQTIARGTALGLLVLICFVLTWKQAALHSDAEFYWRDAVEKNPSAWAAHGNLAGMLGVRGKLVEAKAEYGEALRLKPDFAAAHFELGELLARQGQIADATEHFSEAIRNDPRLSEARYDLAIALEQQKKTDEAQAEYSKIIEWVPAHFRAHNNLANILLRKGARDQARFHFMEALRIKPDFAPAHGGLGNLLSDEGRVDEAIAQYSAAIQCDPTLGLAYEKLAMLYDKTGRTEEARNIRQKRNMVSR